MNLPRHIAIIMDGNGRWAKERGLPRTYGHLEGVNSVREITEECARLDGVEQLTLYTFSSENWKRPPEEIEFLMNLLKEYLVKEREELVERGIALTAIGRIHGLPEDIQQAFYETERMTAGGKKLRLCLALNYGGRAEIVDATRKISKDVLEGKLKPEDIDESSLSRYLYTAGMPDPDLLIRTAGEKRVSNFLLWQVSYAELYIVEVCWPDFRKEEFYKALEDYSRRERRFGGLSPSRIQR